MVESGALFTTSTKLNLRSFFRYPARFIIHLFTGSEIEHVGIVCRGYLYESLLSKGVRKIDLKERDLYKYTSYRIYELNSPLTKKQEKCLFNDLESQLGKKFSIIYSIYSAIDRLLFFIEPCNGKKKFFCSKLVFVAYTKLGLLEEDNANKINPEELIKACKKRNLIRYSQDYLEAIYDVKVI